MHEIIEARKPRKPSPAFTRKAVFRQPHYECLDRMDALQLVVYIPGVDAAGVDLDVREPDLIITAPRTHLVRTNWRALHLEPVQPDYHLCLRLGFSLDYDALRANLRDGVLTITLPKKSVVIPARTAA